MFFFISSSPYSACKYVKVRACIRLGCVDLSFVYFFVVTNITNTLFCVTYASSWSFRKRIKRCSPKYQQPSRAYENHLYLYCPDFLPSPVPSSPKQVSTAVLYTDITVDNTGRNYPMLSGNLVSILFSGFVCTVVSLANPDDYDWESTRNIKMVEAHDNAWHTDEDYNDAVLFKAKRWIMKVGQKDYNEFVTAM